MAMFPFSSPEAALLVSTKKRDLWPGPIPEVRDSRTSRHSAHAQSQVWQIWWVLVSIYFVYQAIQNWNIVRPCQRLRFLVLIKRSVASGDENAMFLVYKHNIDVILRHAQVSGWEKAGLLFKLIVEVPAVGNTADTPNPPELLPF